ncbi:type VII secretion protein EccE [Phytohabitans aurantiacus]|uniref:type VII secretion protein EccE n=1 Tax=Phytohabitans aurantiacus TaxID=3016789 RepID=UPI0024902A32|nr:type VII secretion protein EccE [Phytohabitans aurantiacus]
MSTVATRFPVAPLVGAEVAAAGAALAYAAPSAWWSWAVLGAGAVTTTGALLARRSRRAKAPTPALRIRTVERGGLSVGVAQDTGGWFAVAELAPRLDLRPESAPLPPLAAVARVFADGRDPTAVQLVSHTIAAPSTLLPPESPVLESYQRLTAGESTVAHQVSWVCVRVDACDGAAVVARHGGDREAPARAAAAAILRVSRTLRVSGVSCRVLDARELGEALQLAGVGGVAGGMAEVCYGVDDVPSPLATAVATAPAAVATVATTIVSGPRGLRARRLVRVVAPERDVRLCDTAVQAGAIRAGVALTRLDGRQAPAAYAAGPTGAALPPSGGYAVAGAAAGLDPLDVPWHPVTQDAGEPAGPAASVGVLFGRDVDRRATVVRLFRPWPTEMVVIGGRATAQVLALRALAVGAQVCVRTARYAEWTALAQAARCPDRLVVGAEPPRVAAPYRPTLVVDDLDPDGATTRAPLGPWQARLTVATRLSPAGARRLAEAHLAVLHRIGEDEADVAARALGMTGDTPRALTRLPDDMVALVGGGVNSYTWLEATEWERTVTGAPAPLAPTAAVA